MPLRSVGGGSRGQRGDREKSLQETSFIVAPGEQSRLLRFVVFGLSSRFGVVLLLLFRFELGRVCITGGQAFIAAHRF